MRRLLHSVAVLGLLLASFPDVAAARLIGDEVSFSGTVLDSGGDPVPGMTLVLELRRESFRLLRMKKEISIPVRMITRTDDRGRWSLDWAWDGHYNRFAIVWGLPSPAPEKDLATLERRDVTDGVLGGQPVVADLTLESGPWAEWVVDYLRGTTSADEKEVFGQMGPPDRVEILETPRTRENTWFYFEQGRAYRFADGRLLGVESFDPVSPPNP